MSDIYPWVEGAHWLRGEDEIDPFSNLNDTFKEDAPITKVGLIKDWEGYSRIYDEGFETDNDTSTIEDFKFLPFIFLKDTTKYEAFTVHNARVWTLKDTTLQKRDSSHFYELEDERNCLLERYAPVIMKWVGPREEKPADFRDVYGDPKFIRSLMQLSPFTNDWGTDWTEPAKDPFVRILENEDGVYEEIKFNPYSTSTPRYLSGLFTFFIRRVILPPEWNIQRRHYPHFPKSSKGLTFFNFFCFLPQSLGLLNKYINAHVLSDFSFPGFYTSDVDIGMFFNWVGEMREDQKRYREWVTQFKNFYNSLRADKSITSFLSIDDLLNEASLLHTGFESICRERKETFHTQVIKLTTYREEKRKNKEEDRRFEELLQKCAENKKKNPEKFKKAVKKYADLFKGIFAKE